MSAAGLAWDDLQRQAEPPLRVRGVGLADDVDARLRDAGVEVVDAATGVDAVVVSTRAMVEADRVLAEQVGDCPVVVLAHAGGERAAADLVRSGAWAILGEGNESALWSLVDDERASTRLLSSFERRFGTDRRGAGQGVDASTGLPDVREFERRLSASTETDRMLVVAHVRVIAERWSDEPADVVVSVQRRRLASALAHECASAGAEIYATGANEFTVLAERLDATATHLLGQRLVDAGAMFRDRGLPLRTVVGHAQPDGSATIGELLDRARRASEVASADGQQPVLGAAQLERGISETTELEAVMRLLDEVEPSLPEGVGHCERVGRIVADLARVLGIAPATVSRWHLAAHLHDVGRAGLPVGAVESGQLDGALLEAWRTFPSRSARMLRVAAGPEVAAVVEAQRERFDGGGFPDGRAADAIPRGARVLAVAHAVDEAATAGRSLDEIAVLLRDAAGLALDPAITQIAIRHLSTLLSRR